MVTVTEVEWEVVTVTEYDSPAAATLVTTAPVAAQASTTVVPQAAEQTTVVNNTPEVNTPAQAATASPVVTPAAVQSPSPAAEQPTTVAVAAPAVTTAVAAAAPSQAQTQTSTTSGQNSGDATFYELGLTACGQTYTDSDYVAAISYKLFDINATPNPNSKFASVCESTPLTNIDNANCGKKIRVYRDGKSVDVSIVDRCAGCEGEYDVDLSPSAFNVLATESEGRVPITWSYI